MTNVKSLVLRQREKTKEEAGKASGPLPPETRVSKFTNAGSLKMAFTESIKVPEGTSDLIKKQTVENRRRLAEGEAPEQSLIQVFAVKEEGADPDEVMATGGPIMDGWELISLDGEGFELQLNFTNPIMISGDEQPDLLLIQLDLSSFEDSNGKKLPESVVKYQRIPA